MPQKKQSHSMSFHTRGADFRAVFVSAAEAINAATAQIKVDSRVLYQFSELTVCTNLLASLFRDLHDITLEVSTEKFFRSLIVEATPEGIFRAACQPGDLAAAQPGLELRRQREADVGAALHEAGQPPPDEACSHGPHGRLDLRQLGHRRVSVLVRLPGRPGQPRTRHPPATMSAAICMADTSTARPQAGAARPQAGPGDDPARAAADRLARSFGFDEIEPEEKAQRVRGVFDRVASRYDLMNDLMSGGIHRLWKEALLDWLAPRRGLHLLDIAGGTGDIAQRFLSRVDGEGRATLMPRDARPPRPSDRPPRPDEDEANRFGVRGRLMDLIQCVPGYQGVLDAALGHVLVLDTLDHALAYYQLASDEGSLSPGALLCTLDGAVVDGHGAVTGGAQRGQGASVLAHQRELRELSGQIKDLEERFRSEEEQLVVSKKEREHLTQKLDELTKAGHQGEMQILSLDKDLVKAREELHRTAHRLDVLGSERTMLAEQRATLDRDAEEEAEVVLQERVLDGLGTAVLALDDVGRAFRQGLGRLRAAFRGHVRLSVRRRRSGRRVRWR